MLNLSKNKLGNIGCEVICKSMKKNNSLKYLDMSDNQIEDKGLFHAAKMLGENNSLQVLDLSGNNFEGTVLSQFANGFTNPDSSLYLLKLGQIRGSPDLIHDFISRTLPTRSNFLLCHLETPHYQHPSITRLN